jgi:hypothetical protein
MTTFSWREGLPDPPPLPPGVSEKAIAASPPLNDDRSSPSVRVGESQIINEPPRVRLRTRGLM